MNKDNKKKPTWDVIKEALINFLITFGAGFLAMVLDHLIFG